MNFSDPFGLCPEEQRDKNGYCPGGLTVAQWDRVEYAARNRMTDDARDRVLEMLNDGKISPANMGVIDKAVQWLRGGGSPVAVTNALTGRIRLSDEAFSYSTGDFAFLLAHEAQHVVQGLFMLPKSSELDADAYACANTWGRDGYRGGSYRQWGTCGSPR